ncbi:MAG: pyridoxal-dependent decarboxylase, exosortase A system-associated [Myxococcota bacterium]
MNAPTSDLWPASRLEALADSHGTPSFVYDGTEIHRRILRVRNAFGADVGLLYGVKANPLPALLTSLRDRVDGLDVASEGEVQAALAAGYPPDRLRLAGPAKTTTLLAEAVDRGITVSVESPDELEELVALARRRAQKAFVTLRLEPTTPRHVFGVAMSGPRRPFGLDRTETDEALRICADADDALSMRGVHVYGGTQCRSGRGWLAYLAHVLDLAQSVVRRGGSVQEINAGGGFGVETTRGPELNISSIGPKARSMMAKFPGTPRFVLELGRFLVADAGVYLARVRCIKIRPGRRIAVLDGGVHHLWAATGQLGPTPPIVVTRARPSGRTELFGPLCTPLDRLGEVDVDLEQNDLVAFLRSGAYGATMSPSAFLSHPAVKEIWLGQTHSNIRKGDGSQSNTEP